MDASQLTEIAVFRGACQKMRELWLWCQLARPDAVLISIDLPGGEFGGGYHPTDIARFRNYAQGEQSLHFLRRDSHKKVTREAVVKKLNGRKVDLLFIDGDHRYNGVKKDFEMYAP
jgi:hypothetical protein